jgi:hypothetical protein
MYPIDLPFKNNPNIMILKKGGPGGVENYEIC